MKFKKVLGLGAAAGAVAVSGAANAAGVDYTQLTTAVDFTTAITAIMTVFGAIVLVRIAMVGGRAVMSALR